mgnify:CR=1 FL=1
METMRQGVCEMKNVCTTKSWTDVCVGDVCNSPIMHESSEECSRNVNDQ